MIHVSRFFLEAVKTRTQAVAAARAIQESRLLIDQKEADKLLNLELHCWNLADRLRAKGAPKRRAKKPAKRGKAR